MAPLSAALLLPLTVLNEPRSAAAAAAMLAASPRFGALLATNCALAFVVNLTNFLVTHHCGALTLQVLGNAKGVVAAALSVLIFRNPVTLLGGLGYAITMVGVVAYSESRKVARREPGSPAVADADKAGTEWGTSSGVALGTHVAQGASARDAGVPV